MAAKHRAPEIRDGEVWFAKLPNSTAVTKLYICRVHQKVVEDFSQQCYMISEVKWIERIK